MQKCALAGKGQIDDFIQQFSKESVAIFVLSFWHGDTLIIVQLLVPNFSCRHIKFFHICVCIHQLFKLFIEHFQTVNVNKILNVFKTQFEIL